ncbi:MAG TPA: transposase [Pirellulales bacterium]|nr:transposase [Pirellulales bacterium]
MAETRLQGIVRRIERLPEKWLSRIEELLSVLECGDSSPLSASKRSRSGDESPHSKDWPHAPVHRLSDHGTYVVTAGTFRKEHFFRGDDALDLLESTLLLRAKEFSWQLEAWAVFSNHYHFVAHALASASNLHDLLKQLHGETARELNRLQGITARRVWHNFWDTKLTFEKSHLARLSYVHSNAVKHGLVRIANHYRWCSAAWFERTATRAAVKTIYSFRTDKVRLNDDFEVV